jgi:hypothetical protein
LWGGGGGVGVAEDAVEDGVGGDLEALRVADGALAVVLYGEEVVEGWAGVAEGFGEAVGGGDRVLQRDVDADAADGGHGVCGVADAEEPGEVPAVEDVDLDFEEFDLIPVGDLGYAVGEEGCDADDALVDGFEAGGFDVGLEGVFGDDEGALVVVGAVDEDDDAALIDVAE